MWDTPWHLDRGCHLTLLLHRTPTALRFSRAATVPHMELDRLLGQPTQRFASIAERAAAFDTPNSDSQERVYWALAYRYEEVDTYGTTMTRGAFSKVTPEDFRILEYHKKDRDPVGKPVEVRETDEGLWVGFVWADTPRATELRSLVDGGFLRGVSVGFIPVDGYVRDDGVIVFTEAELHELSLVNTPSSRKALIDLARDTEHPDPDQLAELLGFTTRDEADDAEAAESAEDAPDGPPADSEDPDTTEDRSAALDAAIALLIAQGADPDVVRSLIPTPDTQETQSETGGTATVESDAIRRSLMTLRSLRSLGTRS